MDIHCQSRGRYLLIIPAYMCRCSFYVCMCMCKCVCVGALCVCVCVCVCVCLSSCFLQCKLVKAAIAYLTVPCQFPMAVGENGVWGDFLWM